MSVCPSGWSLTLTELNVQILRYQTITVIVNVSACLSLELRPLWADLLWRYELFFGVVYINSLFADKK